jgi:hypothetical protein
MMHRDMVNILVIIASNAGYDRGVRCESVRESDQAVFLKARRGVQILIKQSQQVFVYQVEPELLGPIVVNL